MPSISELLYEYIQTYFSYEEQAIILTSFYLMELFGLKYYEDKYLDLLSSEDNSIINPEEEIITLSPETILDTFNIYIKKDMLNIIQEHNISINIDNNPLLSELNEIVHFLYIIQNLEDYSTPIYILSSENDPREKLINLISFYTLLSKIRLYELIENVEESFIKNLIDYVEYRQTNNTEPISKNYLHKLQAFIGFIGNTDCLGLDAYNKGLTNLSLEDLVSLLDVYLDEHIDNLISNQKYSQAALDVLSILLLARDSYDLPLLKFRQNSYMFTNSLKNLTKLETILLNMANDFNEYYNASKQKELLNGK